MVTSVLEQYQIADFLEWEQSKRLILNPDFQRRSVWTPGAKVYLIDTILRRLPIPKIYLRQKVNLETRLSYREVVDGQQRLRAIFDFASDRLVMTKRAGEFAGLRYTTMDADQQEAFLSYPIAVDQLVNATDDDVLEVFSRLNSYTLPLNDQEKRHAKYQGDFKWAVREAARRWSVLWERYKVVSIRERVRMADDQLMAEMFGILINGVTDGGQGHITKLYTMLNGDFPQQEIVTRQVDETLRYLTDHWQVFLETTSLHNAPHFLMLFAAVVHALFGIPPGDIGADMPKRDPSSLSDHRQVFYNLSTLAEMLDFLDQAVPKVPDDLYNFWLASSGTTQRIRSRKPRFLTYYKALLPETLWNL